MRKITRVLCFSAVCMSVAFKAYAFQIEPRSVMATVGLGPSVNMGSRHLGAADAFMDLNILGEYAFTSQWSGTLAFDTGFARSVPVRIRMGGRYRFTHLKAPFSPYVSLELGHGWITRTHEGDPFWMGVRVAGGCDYFITRRWGVGVQTGIDMGGTTHSSTFFGTWDMLLTATQRF
jgi:hypothetical protein